MTLKILSSNAFFREEHFKDFVPDVSKYDEVRVITPTKSDNTNDIL